MFTLFAGCIRPSRIRFSSATRAICLRTGSKDEMTIVPGVSSTISSTPAARSNDLMFLPSFPMIFPLMSSDGIVTFVVIISDAVDDASR